MLTVINVEYEGGYTLLCEFSDGVRKRVDLTPLLKYPAFEELRDEKQFIQFGHLGLILCIVGFSSSSVSTRPSSGRMVPTSPQNTCTTTDTQ